MKKAFTLLELVVVIIILGILGTLGIQQYFRMIERARGAEARQILSNIRTQAAALWLERSDGSKFVGDNASNIINNLTVGIGILSNEIPQTCSSADSTKYFFSYEVVQTGVIGFVAKATRCTGITGKTPSASTAGTLTLTTDFNNGTDTWGGNGGY